MKKHLVLSALTFALLLPISAAHAQSLPQPKQNDLTKEEKKKQDLKDARAAEKAQEAAKKNALPLLKGTNAEKLDTLFKTLKTTESVRVQRQAISTIEQIWRQSGSDTIDLLVKWADEFMVAKNYPAALDLLDQVIRYKPNFAHGWNMRATVHYLSQDFGRSIADVERTLALEPRHFGALAGLGTMLISYGKEDQALFFLEKAIELNPAMPRVKRTIERLKKRIKNREI